MLMLIVQAWSTFVMIRKLDLCYATTGDHTYIQEVAAKSNAIFLLLENGQLFMKLSDRPIAGTCGQKENCQANLSYK